MFKEGDEVRVIKKVEPPNWDFAKKMDKLMGETGKVYSIYSNYINVEFANGLWGFHPDCLELAKGKDEIIYA